jgi:hypothetical protein
VNMAKGDTNNSPYTDQVTFKTDSETDQKIFESVTGKADNINSGKEPYNVLTNNCTDAVERPMEQATGVNLPDNAEPNTNFDNLKADQASIQTSLDLKSGNAEVYQTKPGLDGYQSQQVIVPVKKDEEK